MADEHREAALAQRVGAAGEALGRARARQRRLEQQPTAPGRPLGDRLELGAAERGHVVPRELRTGTDLEVDARLAQGALQLTHPRGDPGDVHVRRVRRAGHQARPVAHRLAGERERDRDIVGPVVDARQEVEVKLDTIHPVLE
jgi:hypothetical protein